MLFILEIRLGLGSEHRIRNVVSIKISSFWHVTHPPVTGILTPHPVLIIRPLITICAIQIFRFETSRLPEIVLPKGPPLMGPVWLLEETGVLEENLRCLVESNWTSLFSHMTKLLLTVDKSTKPRIELHSQWWATPVLSLTHKWLCP